jgi:hypothetical protein
MLPNCDKSAAHFVGVKGRSLSAPR